MPRVFRAIGRIGKEKLMFNVEFKPINVHIYTSQAFNLKLIVRRGKQARCESETKSVARSMKNSDLKIVSFTEKWSLPCTYFVKEGVPEAKTFSLFIVKLLPGGEEVIIAKKEINATMHFGEEYQEATIELEIDNKKAAGSIVKSMTYQVVISCKEAKD